jgi:flagellar biosynthesis protein FlhA
MPIIPFAGLSLGAGVLAWRRSQAAGSPKVEPPKTSTEPKEEPISASLAMDDVKIELGYGLLHLINDLEGRRLTDQIKALRKTLASEYGFVMPPVRILDNMRLANQGYAIRIKEMEIGAGEVRLNKLMAMDPRGGQVELPGEHVREPAFGLPATWIEDSLREEAAFRGYTTVDPATVLTTHLTEILKDNMADLLSYAEVQKLLKDLTADEKKLVDDMIPSVATASTVQRVLQALLRERVSIRDLGSILEALLEAAPVNKSLVALVEASRQALGRRLVRPLLDGDGQLPVLLLDPALEEEILATLSPDGGQRLLAAQATPGTPVVRRLTDSVRQLIGGASAAVLPVLLVPSPARYHVKRWLEPVLPRLAVVAAGEIPPEIRLRPVGTVR